jgi:hypothetical protein
MLTISDTRLCGANCGLLIIVLISLHSSTVCIIYIAFVDASYLLYM